MICTSGDYSFSSSLTRERHRLIEKNKHLIQMFKVTANKIVLHPCSALVSTYTQVCTVQYRTPAPLTHTVSFS